MPDYFFPILHTFGFSQQIVFKILHIKSQRNPFSWGRGDACEQTDVQTDGRT